jgi:DNA-binding GntR family transcriptional regulator
MSVMSAPPSEAHGLSSTEGVVAAIRARIIRGIFLPGQRLTEGELATDLGVSRTSIREAVRVLESHGLIRIQPYFGTFVAELSPKEADDLLEVQGSLEPLAAGLAAQRRTNAHVRELWAIVEEGQRAAAEGRTDDASDLHGRFHATLAAASDNASLATLVTQLRDKIDWVYSTQVRRPAGDSWDEHALMVEAIERSGPDGAVEAARKHIEQGVTARRH